MILDLTFNNDTDQRDYPRSFFAKIIKQALSEIYTTDKKWGISINLISAERIRELNRDYRKKDAPTDVLSFPLMNTVDAENNQSAIIELGDIFISIDIAGKKAQVANHSLNYEMAFLVVHGLLHLLGYDHEVSAEKESEMFSLQKKILSKLSI